MLWTFCMLALQLVVHVIYFNRKLPIILNIYLYSIYLYTCTRARILFLTEARKLPVRPWPSICSKTIFGRNWSCIGLLRMLDDQGKMIWFLFCCYLFLMAVNFCQCLYDPELVCRIKQYLRAHANNIEE